MRWDAAATQWINAWAGRSHAADLLGVALSRGGPALLVLLVALLWLRGDARRRGLAVRCGLAALLAFGIDELIAVFYVRTRPYAAGLTHLIAHRGRAASFPSNHASASVAIAAVLLLGGDRWGAPAAVLAALVALSRVYVGAHYLTDVLGGAAVGVLAAFAVAGLYDRLRPSPPA